MLRFLTVAALVVPFSALAADPSGYEAMKRKWETAMKEQHANYVAEVEAKLQAAKDAVKAKEAQLKKLSKNAVTSKMRDELSRAKREVDGWEKVQRNTDARFPAAYVGDLKAGFFGKLGENGRAATPPGFKVVQVIDKGNALVSRAGPDARFYWAEMDTTGLVDDEVIKLDGWVHCTGTRQYETVLGGTRTVLVLKLVK